MVGVELVVLSLIAVSGALDLDGCSAGQPKVINVLQEGLEGDVYSPGYKEGVNYPSDLNCEYTLKAPFGFRILLKFVDMDIDAFDMCGGDSLIVFEGDSPFNPAHGAFCGNETFPDLLSLRNALHIVFTSDFMRSGRGFHLRYKASVTQKLCDRNQGICRNRKCYNATSVCNGKDECGDGTDEEDCGIALPTTTCGKRPNESPITSPDRVVGGQEAIPGSWPWQADMQLGLYHPNGHMCGGTLINAQWLVTAAHCVMANANPLEWRVHFGNHRKFHKDRYEQVRFVEKIIVYPDLVDMDIENVQLDIANEDFALMKLNAPVKFTDQVRPACLPTKDFELKPGTSCMATGWGATRGSGSNDVLKEIELFVQDPKKCDIEGLPMNTKTGICVSTQNEVSDVCHGDSGGPLVCKINGEWQIMGATSRGTRVAFDHGLCGITGAFTIYSKVSVKIDWINKMINKYP